MGRLKRAGVIVSIVLALQPAMLLLGLYAIFPDFFWSIYAYIALLIAVSVAAGTRIEKGIDVISTAIVSAGLYIVLIRLLVATCLSPYLYQGFEAYSLLSVMFLPGFFYFFLYLFLEIAFLFLGSWIATSRA